MVRNTHSMNDGVRAGRGRECLYPRGRRKCLLPRDSRRLFPPGTPCPGSPQHSLETVYKTELQDSSRGAELASHQRPLENTFTCQISFWVSATLKGQFHSKTLHKMYEMSKNFLIQITLYQQIKNYNASVTIQKWEKSILYFYFSVSISVSHRSKSGSNDSKKGTKLLRRLPLAPFHLLSEIMWPLCFWTFSDMWSNQQNISLNRKLKFSFAETVRWFDFLSGQKNVFDDYAA